MKTSRRLWSFFLALTLCLSTAAAAAPAQNQNHDLLSGWTEELYEPKTTIALPPTIVWPADPNAVRAAGEEVRPNTMLAAVDRELRVTTLDGMILASSLEDYLLQVKRTTLPGLYVSDQAAASALSAFCAARGVNDIFVAANRENRDLVRQVTAQNPGVLGIVDFTRSHLDGSRESLHTIVKETNASNAKIAIISQDIATRENIGYLRAMLCTVWVRTAEDDVSIYTQITNGASGIVCGDYRAVARALETFSDTTTLVRQTLIAGHRGLPSAYVENTTRSAQAAVEAGANVLECDVALSRDGVPFVLHDGDAKRLFNRPDIVDVRQLTMAELQALPFDMTDDYPNRAPNSVLNANHTNRTQDRREDMTIDYDPRFDHIPTLREYLAAFADREDVFHFIELKSYDPSIIPVLKAVCEEMGVTDRMAVITFNNGFSSKGYDPDHDLLLAMRRQWPEMSVGYLTMAGANGVPDLAALTEEKGAAVALGTLIPMLRPYNATFNPCCDRIPQAVISAGRHRGLTAWPWTYNVEESFAAGYLSGMYSLTTDFSLWASKLPVRLEVETEGNRVICRAIAQDGAVLENPGRLSLVSIDGGKVTMDDKGVVTGSRTGEATVMVRLDTILNVNNVDLRSTVKDAAYAIYSNPFHIKIR